VLVWPEVALGAVFDGIVLLWFELDAAFDWLMSELLLVLDGVWLAVDDWSGLVVDCDVALGVWLALLFGSVLLDVCAIVSPAESNIAAAV
jgi:hypothetical protein